MPSSVFAQDDPKLGARRVVSSVCTLFRLALGRIATDGRIDLFPELALCDIVAGIFVVWEALVSHTATARHTHSSRSGRGTPRRDHSCRLRSQHGLCCATPSV